MNDNIDIMMSNYLTILGNPELRQKIDGATLRAMETAIAIYTSTTAVKYINTYQKKQENDRNKIDKDSVKAKYASVEFF